MALQLWLPLTCGNSNQYGVSDITVYGTPYTWSVGRYGSNAYFNGNVSSILYNNTTAFNYTGSDSFSVSLFLSKDYEHKTANQSYAFTVGRADTGGYGYGLQIEDTQVRWRYGSSTWPVGMHGDNEFHHYVFVKDGNTIRIYKDGVLEVNQTFSGTHPTYSDGNGLGIGCFHYTSNAYPLTGTIADFRIYDNAVSAREARDLSEGLLLHYTLDNQYCTGKTNMYSGDIARGLCSITNFTRTKLSDEEGYRYTGTYTGTGTNTWWQISAPNLPKANFTVGKTYIWSCKYRVNKWTNGALTFRTACWSNDYQTGGGNIANTSITMGVWREVALGFTMTQAKYDNSSFGPKIEMYTDNMATSGSVYDMSIDIKNVQIIEAPVFPGWVDNNLTTNTIPNEGLMIGKELSRYGTVNVDTSKINRFAYNFAQTGYFYNEDVTIAFDCFTVSLWFKASDTTGNTQHFLVGSFDSWPYNGIGIYRDVGKNYWNIIIKSSNESNYKGIGGQTFSYNEWHHLAIVWNGSIAKVYLDGTIKTTETYGQYGYIMFKNLYLGNSAYNGHPNSETEQCAMSDFRVYPSVFSNERIEELYKCRASIDKKCQAHSITLFEAEYGTTKSVTGRGQIRTPDKLVENSSVTAAAFGKTSMTFTKLIEN